MFQATEFNGKICIFVLILNVAWTEFTGNLQSSNKDSPATLSYNNEPNKNIDTFQLDHKTVQEGIKNGWYATEKPYAINLKDDYEDYQYPPNDQQFESLKTSPEQNQQEGWYGTDNSGNSIDLTNKNLGNEATELKISQPSAGGNQDFVSTSDFEKESQSSESAFQNFDYQQSSGDNQNWITVDLPNKAEELPQNIDTNSNNQHFGGTKLGWVSVDLTNAGQKPQSSVGVSQNNNQQFGGNKQEWVMIDLTNVGQKGQSSVNGPQNFESYTHNQQFGGAKEGWISLDSTSKESQPSGSQNFGSNSDYQQGKVKQEWISLDFVNKGQEPQSIVGSFKNFGSGNDKQQFGGGEEKWATSDLTSKGQELQSSISGSQKFGSSNNKGWSTNGLVNKGQELQSGLNDYQNFESTDDNQQFEKIRNGMVTVRLSNKDFENLKEAGNQESRLVFGSEGANQQFGKTQEGWITINSNDNGFKDNGNLKSLLGFSGSQNYGSYYGDNSNQHLHDFQGPPQHASANLVNEKGEAFGKPWKTQNFGWSSPEASTTSGKKSVKSQSLDSTFGHNQNQDYQQGWTALKGTENYGTESITIPSASANQKLPQGKKLEWTDQRIKHQNFKFNSKPIQNFWINTGESSQQLDYQSTKPTNWINGEKPVNFVLGKSQNLDRIPSETKILTIPNTFHRFQNKNKLGFNKISPFPTIDLTKQGESFGIQAMKAQSPPAFSQNFASQSNKNGPITFEPGMTMTPLKPQELPKTNYGFVPDNSQNIWKTPPKTSYEADFGIVSNDFKPSTPIEPSSGSVANPEHSNSIKIPMPQIVKVPVAQPYVVRIPVPHPVSVPIYQLKVKEVEKKVPVVVKKIVPIYVKKPYKIEIEKHHPVMVAKPYNVHFPVVKHVYIRESEGEWRR